MKDKDLQLNMFTGEVDIISPTEKGVKYCNSCKKDLPVEIYEQCLNSKDYIKYNNWKRFEEAYYFILIFLFYGTRILYQFYRFVRWCFRVVFFDK